MELDGTNTADTVEALSTEFYVLLFFSEAGTTSNQDVSGFRFRISAFRCVYRLSSAKKKKISGPIAGGPCNVNPKHFHPPSFQRY